MTEFKIRVGGIMNESLYTIGQVAGICDLSIQTLRYYDSIGLIKPSHVGPNSYRYYSTKDIRWIRIVQDMKAVGFSLEEIQQALRCDDIDLLLNLLNAKKDDYAKRITDLMQTIGQIEHRINNLARYKDCPSMERSFQDSIELKTLPERHVAFTRYNSSCHHEALVMRYYELDQWLQQHSLGAEGFRMAVYHDFLKDFDPINCDLEVCIQVEPGITHKSIRKIPGGLYATAIYHGAYQGQCQALVEWITRNGFIITGPGIEIYINSFMNTPFPKNYITEVQFPIENA